MNQTLEHKWWVLFAIGIGTFMTALDGSVVNTILPVISQSLNSSVAAVEWVVTIYLLVISGVLLSFGRLGDMQGHKNVYLAGFVIFLVSSALCGLSHSLWALISFRAIQSLGGAMLAANSPAILTKSFPGSQRGQALGLQATMTYLGLTVGPSLGGWLAQQFSWRAVFYINLPVGLFAFYLSLRFILPDHPTQVTERFDLMGAGCFIAGLITLLLGLNQGYTLGWTSLPILALFSIAILFLVIFIYIEMRTFFPMLDLNLFNNRVFSASVISAISNYICVYSILFLMPFYLIQGRGLNTSHTGLILTAMPIVMAIVAPISGTLSDRFGTRFPAMLGMFILALGLLLLSWLGKESPNISVVFSLSIAGLGIGVFISPNNSALMGAAPRYRQGIAAGIMATARNVGMVLGVGLSGAIFTTLLSHPAESQSAALFDATHASFMAAAIIAALGMLVSAIRNA
jgi:EmrB/QacA subfamily drug resistance transporter